MTNFRAIPELMKQSPTTDTEHDLLQQPCLWPAAIEFARNRAMKWRVGGIVAI
jgi:hypothetical protein